VNNRLQQGSFVEEEIDLSQYWKVISRRKWSILSLALLVSLLATLIVFSITPVYKATATMLIEPEQQKTPSLEEVFRLRSQTKEFYLTQMEILKSRRLAEQVIHKLELENDPVFMPEKKTTGVSVYVDQWISPAKNWLKALLQQGDENINRYKADGESRKIEKVVSKFSHNLSASLIKDTQLIRLSFESVSPELAASVVNTLTQVYLDDQLYARVNKTRKATAWMEKRLTVLKANLERSDRALQAYKERHGLIDVKGVSTLTAREIEDMTSKVVDARSKVTELSKRYGSKHPRMIAARSELQAAKALLAGSKSLIQHIGRKAVKLRELQRQVESNRSLYDTFMSRLKEASQAISLQSVNTRVSDQAIAPLKPFKPKKGLIIALAFFASLMFGVLLSFLYEALDKTFKSTADIENKLGLPILGLLPLIRENKKNRESHALAMSDPDQTSFAEAMRTIRTGLILSSLDNPHKVILVTSSVPGEGKTIVSTNLAAAMGKMEKVLLIGADLRRPSLSRAVGLHDHKLGLSNIVAGTANFKSCIHRHDALGVDVLPCGQIPPNPLELLSSSRFGKMLEALERYYDRIVIDSPPLQAVSDALVLSGHAKAVVYVIEADSTHQHAVENGVKRLQQHGAPIAGVVLNKFDVEKADKYGYDYAGYYDQYGYSNIAEK